MEPNPSDSDSVGYCDLCLDRHSLIKSTWNPYAGVTIERKLCVRCCSIFSSKTTQFTTKALNVAHSRYLEWEQHERVRLRMNQRQLKLTGV